MVAKKLADGWHVVKKGGKLGKRAYTSQENANKAQARGRALSSGSSATGKSPKSSTSASAPSGGASTSTPKMGALWKSMRTLLNLFAGALNPSCQHPASSFESKLRRAFANYTGVFESYAGRWDWHWGNMAPTLQGIGVSIVNDWWDRKTRNASKISRGKIVPIIAEAIPALRAHFAARESNGDYMWTFLDHYNKYTDGYSMRTHTWDFARVEMYAGAKAASWAYDKVVPRSWRRAGNNLFPKGINPF